MRALGFRTVCNHLGCDACTEAVSERVQNGFGTVPETGPLALGSRALRSLATAPRRPAETPRRHAALDALGKDSRVQRRRMIPHSSLHGRTFTRPCATGRCAPSWHTTKRIQYFSGPTGLGPRATPCKWCLFARLCLPPQARLSLSCACVRPLHSWLSMICLSDASLDDAGQITADQDLPIQRAELLL